MFVFYQLSPDRSVTLSLAFETIASWMPLSEHIETRDILYNQMVATPAQSNILFLI